jgi:hypothetical protein
VAHVPNPSYSGGREAEIRKIQVQSNPRQIVQEDQSQKYPTQKKFGSMAQVVQCLTSKLGTLSSNPSTPPKKEKEDVKEGYYTFRCYLKVPRSSGLVDVRKDDLSVAILMI